MAISLAGVSFRPRWWAGLLALAFCAATVSLGNWQSGRAEDKRHLAAGVRAGEEAAPQRLGAKAVDPAPLALRRLVVQGEFVPARTVLLDNKIHRGRLGYFVITPLRIEGSDMHVLVKRGWVAAGARREDLPSVRTPSGPLTVEGTALLRAERALDAGGGPASGPVWQNLSFEEFRAWSGLQVQPLLLEQRSDTPDGLARDWPAPDFGIDKHRSYAMQWYLMAVFSIVLFIVLSVRRDRSPAP